MLPLRSYVFMHFSMLYIYYFASLVYVSGGIGRLMIYGFFFCVHMLQTYTWSTFFFPKSFNGLSTHMLILHHTCIFRWLASRKRPSYTVEFDETGNPDDYEFYACLHEKSDGSSEDDSDVPSQEDVSPCALRFHSIYFCVLHLRL